MQSNRWTRELTESELKRAMQDPEKQIVEWPIGNLTFVLSRRYRAIIRTGSLGGDVRDIHGGWFYPHDLAFMLDRREIMMLPENVKVKRDRS